MDQVPFDMSKFLTDYLCLHGLTNSGTRQMYPSNPSTRDPYAKLWNQDPLEVLGEIGFKPQEETHANTIGSPIQEFFRGTNVFITGGTGFIGKLLTEKLVRSVPHIQHIYLLIRPKRGKTCRERFEHLLEDQVFLRMKVEVPHYKSKISAVEGDLASDGLGLAESDRRLLADRVHVVFHGAADVRFVEPLRAAVESNVYGSRRVLQLAKQMTNIKSYVHVSTAYSQCVRRVVPESIPKMSIGYEEILKEIESKTDEEIEQDLTRILQGWPNTYTFSKALSEDMVREEAGRIPVCIFRPSAVVSTYKEPVRGYVDNLYGPLGVMIGSAMGLIHCFRMSNELNLNAVPVDYTANCMIAAAWHIGRDRTDKMQVYNFALSPVNRHTWKLIIDTANRNIHVWPYNQTVWYQSFFRTDSKMVDKVAHILLHKIPGIILDKIAPLFGEKPRFSKIYSTIESVKEPLHYFLYNTWEFQNDNVVKLWNSMAADDKQLYSFDLTDLDTIEFSMLGKLGLRYYYLKEKMETLPKAVSRLKWLRFFHYTLKTVVGALLLKTLVATARVVPI